MLLSLRNWKGSRTDYSPSQGPTSESMELSEARFRSPCHDVYQGTTEEFARGDLSMEPVVDDTAVTASGVGLENSNKFTTVSCAPPLA